MPMTMSWQAKQSNELVNTIFAVNMIEKYRNTNLCYQIRNKAHTNVTAVIFSTS